ITTTMASLPSTVQHQLSDCRMSGGPSGPPRRQASRPALFSLRLRKLPMNDAPFEPTRFVDDALEQPADRVWSERAFARDLAHMLQHVLLTIGLVDLDSQLLFHAADFADAPRPLVQQPYEHFVDTID